jgi:Uma2 family endonuclease
MAEVGLFAPDARVELIEGEIFDMQWPIGKDHGSVVDQLSYLFIRTIGDRATVRVQGSIVLSSISMPRPDVAILKPQADFYRSRHPTGDDTLLIVEVSDSSLRHDRRVKVPLSARHGVPEVWIVDLQNNRLLFYRSLVNGEYLDTSWTSKPDVTPIAALSQVSIDLSRLLGA